MKNFVIKYVPWLVIAAMFIALIPGILTRVENESKNNNITISVLYNDLYNKVSAKKLESFLDECKNSGINTISIMEDDLNALVSRGEVTSIKYNILRHKYDDESMRVAEAIEKNCPDVTFDSHIVLAKKEYSKQKLAYMIPQKFDAETYFCINDVEGMDIYVFYNGRKELWDYAFGYDEAVIKKLSDKGFNISLIFKIKNYEKQDYLKDIDALVKKYNIQYFNVKEESNVFNSGDIKAENYKGIAKIINDNNMTLVVTENTDQLSNQKFMGYSEVFNEVMSYIGSKKVVRSYETYDNSQAVGADYSYRVSQLFNSTVDRNIRFITLTQMVLPGVSFEDCADLTLEAAKIYKQKAESIGFTIGGNSVPYDYNIHKTINYCASAVIMVMFALVICQKVFGLNKLWFAICAYAVAFLAVGATVVMPEALKNLYPTAYSAIMSCFVMAVILSYVNYAYQKINFIFLVLSVFALTVGTLLICSIGMGAMLSGINYYVNNDIFRGIKISLLVPVAFTMLAYYLVFIKTKETKVVKSISKVLSSEIKVYWVLIAGVIGIIGMYYIVRSGNVNSISSGELWLRNTVTELFPERPRTKEFLIGYPSLLLFLYYTKNHNIKLVSWVLSVGASILAASVTNSFCHVFTNYLTIVTRTINGLIVGIGVCVVAFVGNLILVKVVNLVKKRI